MFEEVDKKPILDLFADSDSGSDSDCEHDLSFYVQNRVKLMKKIFKVMTSKRIIRMAPQYLKNVPLSEMKTLLLDELMGISNKRLTSVILDKPREVGSSSSESEHIRPKPHLDTIDGGIISLDDITDDDSVTGILDDNCMEIELSERERLEMEFECPDKNAKRKHKKSKHPKKKHTKLSIKKEPVEPVTVKQEIVAPSTSKEAVPTTSAQPDEPVMSALNLLELQARARAIRSQLRCELNSTTEEPDSGNCSQLLSEPISGEESDAVVVVSPMRDIVVVNESSHSENEGNKENGKGKKKTEGKKVENSKEEIIQKVENKTEEKQNGTVQESNKKVIAASEKPSNDTQKDVNPSEPNCNIKTTKGTKIKLQRDRKPVKIVKIDSVPSKVILDTPVSMEDDPEDSDVLIMNVTQEYDDFDREFANVPLKQEVIDD